MNKREIENRLKNIGRKSRRNDNLEKKLIELIPAQYHNKNSNESISIYWKISFAGIISIILSFISFSNFNVEDEFAPTKIVYISMEDKINDEFAPTKTVFIETSDYSKLDK